MAKSGPGEKVQVTRKALDDLKARASKSEELKKQLNRAIKANQNYEKRVKALETNDDNLTKENETLTKEKDDATKSYSDLKELYDELTNDYMQKQLTIEDLQKKIAQVPARASYAKPKVDKSELNQELVNHVTTTAKTVIFRTWKFIEDHIEEEEVTREIIDYLPVALPIPVEEFVENYSNIVYETIKNARTEVQSNGKKRAIELYNKIGILPETEQILKVLAMSPEDLQKPENNVNKFIQLWYTDRWLPVVIGTDYWDENHRHYKFPTDTCKIPLNDGTEEEKVLCTVTSEAFGLLTYDNCRGKWANILSLRTKNPGAAIPRKGDEAIPFQAKFTLTKEGQKKYGGWSKEAYKRFDELQSALDEIRKDDAENGKAKQKYCLKCVRELHKIPDEATDAEGDAAKKRARTPTPPPAIDPSKRMVKRRKE